MTELSPQFIFGTAVRFVRERNNFSQEDLAERSGLDRTYISGIERGVRNPTLLVICKLANALNVTLGELFAAASVDGSGKEK